MKVIKICTTRREVNYGIGIWPRRWWWMRWLPSYHEGRGNYLSVGLWVVAIYRGY